MAEERLKIELISPNQEIPFKLLESADPSRSRILGYLNSGQCYLAVLHTKLIGVLVLDTLSPTTLEIKNIAIAEPYQGKGYGKQLLKFAANIAREFRCQQLVIGTGNSSIGQLALYQKVGFDLIRIERNFFTNHYAEPIFENGIQCKHLLVLEKKLVN